MSQNDTELLLKLCKIFKMQQTVTLVFAPESDSTLICW